MKKLVLAAAIASAAAISTSAHAVTSSISGVQMWVGTFDMFVACPGTAAPGFTLAIGGSTSSATMTGDVCLDPTGSGNPLILLDFNLSNGNYVASSGTTFTGGVIDIYSDTGSGYVYYGSVNASATSIPCLANQTGHLGLDGNGNRINTTAGLMLANGTNPLPGGWVGTVPGAGLNSAVCVTTLLGQTAGLFLTGTVTAP